MPFLRDFMPLAFKGAIMVPRKGEWHKLRKELVRDLSSVPFKGPDSVNYTIFIGHVLDVWRAVVDTDMNNVKNMLDNLASAEGPCFRDAVWRMVCDIKHTMRRDVYNKLYVRYSAPKGALMTLKSESFTWRLARLSSEALRLFQEFRPLAEFERKLVLTARLALTTPHTMVECINIVNGVITRCDKIQKELMEVVWHPARMHRFGWFESNVVDS